MKMTEKKLDNPIKTAAGCGWIRFSKGKDLKSGKGAYHPEYPAVIGLEIRFKFQWTKNGWNIFDAKSIWHHAFPEDTISNMIDFCRHDPEHRPVVILADGEMVSVAALECSLL
jgi:hypothetical protein